MGGFLSKGVDCDNYDETECVKKCTETKQKCETKKNNIKNNNGEKPKEPGMLSKASAAVSDAVKGAKAKIGIGAKVAPEPGPAPSPPGQAPSPPGQAPSPSGPGPIKTGQQVQGVTNNNTMAGGSRKSRKRNKKSKKSKKSKKLRSNRK